MNILDKKYAGVLLITPEGKVIMQQRDNEPGIVNPGKITTFGGSLENDEDPKIAALRELKEELSLDLPESRLSQFGVFNKSKEIHGEDVTCYIYLAKNIDPATLDVREGRGYVEISKNDDLESSNLSALALEILKEYFRTHS